MNLLDIEPYMVSRVGEDNGNSILTDEQVKEIKILLKKYRHGMVTAISRAYGVRPATIQGIRDGRRWKHIEVESA
jgi:hypothetical protein